MGGSSIPPTAGAGLEEAEPTQSPLLQLSSNPLAATAVGAIVALASPRLSTNGAEEDIPIHILVFSIIGIFCFCSSRAAPTFLSNHPVIAQCYELIGVLSVGFFLSSLVTIVVLPRHSWVAYTSGLLAMLPLLHKPGQLLYRWLSHSLDSIYQLLIRRFFPAKSLVVFDSENERIKNYKQRTATSHHLKMLWHSYWIIYHLSKVKGDAQRSDEYYSRAILADPSDGDILSQYAKLVWELHHDEDCASSYFERAVQVAPQNSHVLASYAELRSFNGTQMMVTMVLINLNNFFELPLHHGALTSATT
ncbi:uncharacterized protein [Typha angustifolia]|uniref:uncharacterized protein isoform X1 n=1 Tax=Typha angustifolia TaxID=59011 RepID=UPI003C2BEBC4